VQVRAHACDAADHFNTILPSRLPALVALRDQRGLRHCASPSRVHGLRASITLVPLSKVTAKAGSHARTLGPGHEFDKWLGTNYLRGNKTPSLMQSIGNPHVV